MSAADPSGVLAPLSSAARRVHPLPARAPGAGPATAFVSPLAVALTTMRATARPAPPPQTVAAAAPASPGFVRRSAPVAGVLAALTALAAVGLAGAARSTNGLAACLDLARLSFPRFRILPCPSDATPRGAAQLGAITGAAPPTTTTGGAARSGRGHRVFGRLPALRLPRLSGVLGGAIESDQPWKFLNALLLSLLLGANLFLAAVRSRIARLQSR